MTSSEPEPRALSDTLLDILVYAPIGLTLDSQELTPELAKRGRQHAAAARKIGELAVKSGLRRLDEILAQVGDTPDARTATKEEPEPELRPEAEAAEQQPATADHLAIPDYDLLAASQVVKRLDGLAPDELEAVRVYEASGRDRRTILHKIARLQD